MIKTRRLKSDHISTLVNHYLKKRQFTDGSELSTKKEKKHCQGVEEMAVTCAVDAECSITNSYSFSSLSPDSNLCDLQYTRLKTFILEGVEPYREELQQLLYPLFVHVYLELISNGHKTPGHKFFSRHHTMFRSDASQESVLNDLQQMFHREDVTSSSEVNEFREHKYSVSLSEDAFHYVFRFLKCEESVLLIQVFNKYFDFRVGDTSIMTEPQQSEEKSDCEGMALASPPCTPENKVIQNEVTLSSLQQCITTVRNGPPCLPSICLYAASHGQHGMCSVGMSADRHTVAIGYEDSSVGVWSLTPDKLKPQPAEVNVSNIHMYGDYPEDITTKNSSHVSVGGKELVLLRGHSGAVYGTSFTSDPRFLLSASEDTTVRLWDLKTFTSTVVYKGHNYPVWAIDASLVGGYFVTGSHDRTAKLWTTDRVFPVRTFLGHLADVDVVHFHPNCNYVATGSSDRVVRLWSVNDGQSVRLFQGHKAAVYALTFSSDGKYLASAGEDRRVKVWDLSAGSLYKDLKGHTDTVYSLCFNPDSTLLASGGLDGTVRIWNVESTASAPNMQSSTPNSSTPAPNPNQEVISPELLASFPVRATTIHYLHYTKRNSLLAVGGPSS